MYKVILIVLLCFGFGNTYSQDKFYDVNIKKDATILGVGAGFTIIGHVLINNTDVPNATDIGLLSKADISRFDRWAANNSSGTAQSVSDIFLYSSVSLPFFIYLSSNSRGNELDIGIMAFETFLITNGITNIFKGSFNRFRPLAYNEDFDLEGKLTRGTRHSFISGHASNTAALSFFTAKVLLDLHPELNNKYLVWIPTILIPATISYLRVEAGKHFPTDVIAGYALGAAVGYLIPTLHKHKNIDLSISPLGGLGLSMIF